MRFLVIQNCAAEGFGLYEQYLVDQRIEYEVFHAYLGDRFPHLHQFDGFFVGGTPISAYEVSKHHFLRREWRYLKRIVKSNKPYLGICFGGQLLAELLGAEVRKNPCMEIGIYEVKLTSRGKKDPLFDGFPDRFPVFHWHGDTFDIPTGAGLLVEGEECRNQAFRYERAVALQFHLEVTAQDASRWADAYGDELHQAHKEKGAIIAECKTREPEMKVLAYRLLDNFFELIERVRCP